MNAKKKAGPKPEILKIQGDWREAMKKALKKKRPSILNSKGKVGK